MSGAARTEGPRAWAIASAAVAAVSFVPFLRGVLAGDTFYFRDLSRAFFPTRLFVLEGLRRGELRFWNPFNHEGVPLPFSPLGYPLDLLQLLRPDEAGLSLLLALHVPLAALGFLLLARELRTAPVAAAGGSLLYALGGFALSTLNFYVYLQAVAWAPIAVWALLRAAEGGGRRVALAAVAVAIAWSTAGVEIVAQAVAVGAVLAWRARDVRRAWRVALATLLSVGLAAPVLLVMSGASAGTARARGFAADAVLNQSVHPFTFLQTIVGRLYGELDDIANRWWGVNFFENGFPYILSLYLGATALALAAGGLSGSSAARGRLALLAVAAVIACLGRFVGWAPIVDALPAPLRGFRFPTKAFFTLHLAVAMLCALGLQALADGHRRAQSAIAAAALALGGLLTLAPAWPVLAPQGTAWFIAHFFPTALSPATRAALLDGMLADAARGGLVVILLALLTLGTRRGVLAGRRAALIAVGLLAADLLRTGAGLNPTTRPGFCRPSPEVASLVSSLRPTRIHTCEPAQSRAYWLGRTARRDRHEAYTFAVWRDGLAPHFNMMLGVPSALSEDITSLVPLSRVPPPGVSCRRFDEMAPLLREAAVSHVLSLDPLASPALTPSGTAAPDAIAPAAVHAYALTDARARLEVLPAGHARMLAESTDRLTLEILAPAAGRLIVHDGHAPGWQAEVDGRATPVAAHAGRHRSVPVPAGRSVVEMRYRAPGWRSGLALMGATAAILAWLAWRDRPAAPDSGASPATAAP